MKLQKLLFLPCFCSELLLQLLSVCLCGGEPPHQGWGVRQEVPALCLPALNRQLGLTEGKFCLCPGKAGVSNTPDMVQQKLSELQLWAGVKCNHQKCKMCASRPLSFLNSLQVAFPDESLASSDCCLMLCWAGRPLAKALHAAGCAAGRRGL